MVRIQTGRCSAKDILHKESAIYHLLKGAFNNYVDKVRGEGLKNVCFCPHSGCKNCPRSVGGGKGLENGKIRST